MAYASVAVTPGVGAGIAFDTFGGVSYQRIKIGWGTEGIATEAATATPFPTIPGMQQTSDFSELAINISASGDNDLIAAGAAGVKHRVWMFWLKVNGAAGVSLKFKDGAGTDFHPALPFNDKDGWVMGAMGRPWFTGSAATKLILNLSAAIQVSGRLYYTSV